MGWRETERKPPVLALGKAADLGRGADNSPGEGRFLESWVRRDPVTHGLSFLLNLGDAGSPGPVKGEAQSFLRSRERDSLNREEKPEGTWGGGREAVRPTGVCGGGGRAGGGGTEAQVS